MLDPLSGLRELLLVIEKRSFTAAAAVLGVSPSAVSQSVRALEERVGVRLLQRTTRSVGLTEAGEQFLSRVRPALNEVRSAFEALGELRSRPAGTLRLNVSRLVSRSIIEPILEEFLSLYPEISLEVCVEDRFANIVEQGWDAGIRLGESLDREMVALPISKEQEIAIVGSPSYFEKRGTPKHPRELYTHDCIGYRRLTTQDLYRWEFTEDGKDFEVAVRGRVTTNDPDLMLRAALDGLGLACLIQSSIQQELAEKKLVRVLEEFCPPFPGYFLYYPSRRLLAPKLRALIDFLKDRDAR